MFNSNKLQRKHCQLIINRACTIIAFVFILTIRLCIFHIFILPDEQEQLCKPRANYFLPSLVKHLPLAFISIFRRLEDCVHVRRCVQFTFVTYEPGMAHLKKFIRCPRGYIALSSGLFFLLVLILHYPAVCYFYYCLKHFIVKCCGFYQSIQMQLDNRNFELSLSFPPLSLPPHRKRLSNL